MARIDSEADFFGMERVVSLCVTGGQRHDLGRLENGRSSFRHQIERRDRLSRLRPCRRHRARRVLTFNEQKPDF